MTITKKEFQVLSLIVESHKIPPQRKLAEQGGFSLGTANRILKALQEKGLVDEKTITEEGMRALEPYRVKRAVFIAAGFGSRLAPVSLTTPKPLISVKGKRLIDGLLDAVLAAGIEEIYVVRGYKAEQFDILKEKYPQIRFVENPDYAEANNILSALKVSDKLERAYLFDADLLLHNPALIRPYQYESNFLGIYAEKTDDWCFTTRGGYILEEKRGGENCYQVIGISYWDEADGKKLKEDLARVVQMPGGKEYYWEQVPMAVLKKSYRVAIRPCQAEDIQEIDTFTELKALDPEYENYRGEI